jgi:hypothetical protein
MGLFSDRMIANHTLGQTVFVARCDIPRAPMLKHPIKQCHLKKGILRTDRSPHTEWKGDSGPTHRRCLLLLPPPASSIDVTASPLPSPPPSPRRHRRAAIAVALMVMTAAMAVAQRWRQAAFIVIGDIKGVSNDK